MSWDSNEKVVRQTYVVSDRMAAQIGDAGIEAAVAETDAVAFQQAARLGIKRLKVRRDWDIHVICAFTDYPMYLLGPNAPQVRTWKDALSHGFPAQYTIIIRCQDQEDAREEQWLTEEATKMRTAIMRLGKRAGIKAWREACNWQPNVVKKVRARMEAGEQVKVTVKEARWEGEGGRG